MAETVGAVASAAGLVSLTSQLFENASKLMSFRDRYKDAPETVTDLAHELVTIAQLLENLKSHRQEDLAEAALLDRCISTCHKKTAKLGVLVDKLDNRLCNLNRVGQFYVATKHADISKLLDEVDRAKMSVMLAFQPYYWYGHNGKVSYGEIVC